MITTNGWIERDLPHLSTFDFREGQLFQSVRKCMCELRFKRCIHTPVLRAPTHNFFVLEHPMDQLCSLYGSSHHKASAVFSDGIDQCEGFIWDHHRYFCHIMSIY